MGSLAVTKAVAKKLKYYVDIKRREDGFDLTGPFVPQPNPVPLRPGPTLAYDGLHDRSLKHYFRSPEMKKQVGKMLVLEEHSPREKEIRKVLDEEMSKRCYKLKPGSSSPYVCANQRTTPKHRPQALITVDEYLKSRRGSKQRKIKPDVVGKPRKTLRRSPSHRVRRNERERLVNSAARIIAATEAAALPGNRSSQTRRDSSTYESSLPELNSKSSYAEESSGTEISVDIYPRPPSRAGSPRPRWTPPCSFNEEESGKSKPRKRSQVLKSPVASSDTSEDIRDQVKNLKISDKKSSTTANGVRPASSGLAFSGKTQKSRFKQTRGRPRSARIGNWNGKKIGKNFDVASNGQNRREKTRQTMEQQTLNSFAGTSDEEKEGEAEGVSHRHSDEDLADSKLYRRSQRSHVVTYEVYVVTGNRPGAGTEADIKITLFGDLGNTGERALLKSMNHSRKFRKGQVDIFPIDSIYLGNLQGIRIGHTKTSPGYGWFLEKVYISEGEKENRVFEFPCQRWFSSQKDDGQIIRDICISQLITESELTDKLGDYVSPGEGTSGDESDASFTSVESSDEGKEVELGELSSEDERTAEKKRREKSGRSKNKRSTLRNTKQNRCKKTVSFEKENGKELGDSDDVDEKKSEVEDNYSEAESKKTSRNNTERSNSSDRKAEGEKTEVEKTEENVTENSFEDDDFWSNNSEKSEPIHYDLGFGDDDETKAKKVLNSDSRSASSDRSSSSLGEPEDNESKRAGNDRQRVGNEDKRGEAYNHVSDEERSRGTRRKENRDEQSKKDDTVNENGSDVAEAQSNQIVKEDEAVSSEYSNQDYMAGFLAGIRAGEHHQGNDKDEPGQSGDENGLNDSVDDGDFILKKGPSLHTAVSTGNTERVKELIEHSPSLKEQTDEKGWIPLHVGCARGQLECAKLIAVSGGNLEQETPTGYTSMHLAAMNGHVNCMMVLFALGAEINCRTIDEYTPLHLAAMSGHVECVKWLLANRAKHDVTDVDGRAPVELAEEYCNDSVAELLKSFKKEMTRSDSTLAHLMTYEGKRKKSMDSTTSDTPGMSSKIVDSGVGGLESGEESWVSDNENKDLEKERNSGNGVPGRKISARRTSSSRSDDSVTFMNRTDSITSIEEKQKLYQRQRQEMKKRNSSFLDSIRMDVEDDFNTDL